MALTMGGVLPGGGGGVGVPTTTVVVVMGPSGFSVRISTTWLPTGTSRKVEWVDVSRFATPPSRLTRYVPVWPGTGSQPPRTVVPVAVAVRPRMEPGVRPGATRRRAAAAGLTSVPGEPVVGGAGWSGVAGRWWRRPER